MNDVDYCARSCGFEVFQKCPSVTAVGGRGVYALGREVIKFLKVSVPVYHWLGNVAWVIVGMRLHYNFLFVGVLERFGPLNRVFTLCTN